MELLEMFERLRGVDVIYFKEPEVKAYGEEAWARVINILVALEFCYKERGPEGEFIYIIQDYRIHVFFL